MHIAEKWRCVNPGCCAELIVTESSRLQDSKNPRCGCGEVMKRAYEKPALGRVVAATGEPHAGVPGSETARLGVDAYENTSGH